MKHINHHEIVSNFSGVKKNHGTKIIGQSDRSSRIRGVFGVVWTCPGGGRLGLVMFFSCVVFPIFIKKRGIGFFTQCLTHFWANVEGFFFHCTVKFPLQVMVSTYLMTRVHRCCTDEIPLLTVMCVFCFRIGVLVLVLVLKLEKLYPRLLT